MIEKMTDFSTRHSEDVIIEEFLAEYEKGMSFFHAELFDLNISIYILDQIVKFPFDLFVAEDKTIFFNYVIRNFFNATLLGITRLATDQGDDLYTLMRFKNRLREIVKPEFLAQFDRRLKKYRFEKNIKEMFERAKGLRDERVHAIRTVSLGISGGTYLNFAELKVLRDALVSLLTALSFNEERIMLPASYDPQAQHPLDSNHKSDIEEILDSVAMNSAWLRLPERNPNKWNLWRARLSKVQIGYINYYRSKLDLPEA